MEAVGVVSGACIGPSPKYFATRVWVMEDVVRERFGGGGTGIRVSLTIKPSRLLRFHAVLKAFDTLAFSRCWIDVQQRSAEADVVGGDMIMHRFERDGGF